MDRPRFRIKAIMMLAVLLACLAVAWGTRPSIGPGPRAAYDGIEIGMSLDEVSEAFGQYTSVHCDFGKPGPRDVGGEVRFRETWYIGRFSFDIHFGDDGRVVGKQEYYSPSAFDQCLGWMRRRLGFFK